MPKINVVLLIGLICIVSSVAFAEEFTLTTYYPAPYGIYREMRAQRMAIGDNYYDSSAYCWQGTCTNTIGSAADLVVQGDVGIGTVTPSATVHIYVPGGSSDLFRIDDTASDTTPFVVDNSGSVAIGKAAPATKLDVATNAGSYVAQFNNASNASWGLRLDTASGDPNTKALVIENSGSPLLHMKTNGDMGIGVANPSAKLEVNGNIIASTPTANNHVATKQYVDDIKGWERKENTRYGAYSEVSCNTGKKLLGGGCYAAETAISGSYPKNDTTWRCTVGNSQNLTAYAICAYCQ